MTALIDVDQLRTFIAIAETGSFTKAAEVVNKTQSAVSMHVRRLEEALIGGDVGFQGLTPLAILCRPSGANTGRHRPCRVEYTSGPYALTRS